MSTLLIGRVYTSRDVYRYTGNGDLGKLRLALAYGNNSTEWYRNVQGRTALHKGASEGNVECMRELLDRGAHVESNDNNGTTALIIAAGRGHIGCMRELLDRDADIESNDNNGTTALMKTASRGHIECMRELLDRGANIETYDFDLVSVLTKTASRGRIDCMRELLDKGANIESKDNTGITALMSAAGQGRIECMRELLDKGADIESMDDLNNTALFFAAGQGRIVCMRELLDRGADIESESCFNQSALLFAAMNGQLNSTRLLLDRGAFINEGKIKNSEGLNQECKQMIRDEILHRLRRAAFDSFINHHIEYPPLIHNIYSRCYPSGDLRVTSPVIGWDRAEAVRDKYYFDEVLFYVHLYVANELAKQNQSTRPSASTESSNVRDFLASNSDMTSTLMTVLADRLKMYLKPELGNYHHYQHRHYYYRR